MFGLGVEAGPPLERPKPAGKPAAILKSGKWGVNGSGGRDEDHSIFLVEYRSGWGLALADSVLRLSLAR